MQKEGPEQEGERLEQTRIAALLVLPSIRLPLIDDIATDAGCELRTFITEFLRRIGRPYVDEVPSTYHGRKPVRMDDHLNRANIYTAI